VRRPRQAMVLRRPRPAKASRRGPTTALRRPRRAGPCRPGNWPMRTQPARFRCSRGRARAAPRAWPPTGRQGTGTVSRHGHLLPRHGRPPLRRCPRPRHRGRNQHASTAREHPASPVK